MPKLLHQKPKWFELSRYPQNEFDLYQWAYNLHVRHRIMVSIKKGKPDNEVKELIQQCRDEGFLKNHFSISSNAVQSITGLDVSELKKQLPEQILDVSNIFEKMNHFKEPDYLEWKSIEIHDQLKKACDMPEDKLYISVNLNAPLNVLMEQFDNLIREKQVKKIKKSGITEEKIKKIIKYNVLAYIDLTIFAIEKGKKIANTDADNWLFPHKKHQNVSDFIKRNTKPLVDELLKPDCISSLVTQTGKSYLF